MPIERDVGDRRFTESLEKGLQDRNLRFFESAPDVKHVREKEPFLMLNSGSLYLAVRYQGEILKVQLS
jgi:hypothetical protein